MYRILATVPRRYYPELLAALLSVQGARLTLPSEAALSTVDQDRPVSLGIEAPDLQLVDALKGWLDIAPADCSLRLSVGRNRIPMRTFCRRCQDGPNADLRAPVRPCEAPPTARDFCPLVFAMQQASLLEPPKSAPRRRAPVRPTGDNRPA